MARLLVQFYCSAAVAVFSALSVGAALADGNPSFLPDTGNTRSFNASEEYQSPGGFMPPGHSMTVKGVVMPHSQMGTLTINRPAVDSVHITASEGLDAFDQTLHVDERGVVDQPKSPYPFADLLNSVTGMMASAPAGLQKDTTWDVTVSTPSWMSAMGMSKEMSSIKTTAKVTAVAGNTMLVHADGKNEKDVSSVGGSQKAVIAVTVDCAFVSSQMQKCSRKTSMEVSLSSMDIIISDTVELNAK